MAYAALFSLAQTIDRILNDDDQYPISVDGKQQISSLHKQVIFLQDFLENFPKEASSLDKRTRDAANEAEDIIEHFMYEQIRSRYKFNRSVAAERATVKSADRLYDLRELKMATEEMNSIAREVTDIKNSSRMEEVALGDSRAAPTSSSTPATTGDNIMIGFGEDLLKINELLYSGSSKRQVIPIIGMGGIGKTTLARNAFDDRLIIEHFPVRAWVTVSQDYKTQNILSNLLESMKNLDAEGSAQSNDSVGDRVYKILKGRKYLIVLDDIWSEDAWNDINRLFPDDNNGSRIMLTTRLSDVASHADSSSPIHEMRFMEAGQSWDLLRQKVFGAEDCPDKLEGVGKDIARSCGGLPLAIVLIAGVLSTVSRDQASWEKIANNIRSAFDHSKGGQFEKIISLSYAHLPHQLRPCFLYMGGFPEDYEIRVSKLIKQWIAEGFVKPSVSKSLEEWAEEYLEELVKRSLALVRRRKSNGKIKSCSVHDLVRDLCKRKAQDEDFQRRLSIAHSDLMRLAKTYGSTIRSIICFQPNELGSLRKFRLLRVLDVVDANVYSLPAQVFELFHLRYLAFGCPMEIPAAISKLQNLHTLIICPRKGSRYSTDEVYLPSEIWMLPLLTHLVSFFDLLPSPDGAAFPLEKLQTLCLVKKFVCTKRILEMVPKLKKLGITYFGDKHGADYQLQNLVFLHQLEKLRLSFRADSVVRLKANPVLPKTLKKLTLSGWRLPWEYMATVGFLPNLQVLKLRDHACEDDTWETAEDQFPCLEFLLIDESNLRNWSTEMGHFPMLKRLVLYRCSLLSEIPDDIGEIPTLDRIEVDYANASLVECVKRIQEEQQDNGNDYLQVHCVHYQGV